VLEGTIMAPATGVVHVVDTGGLPSLPGHRRLALPASIALHATALLLLVTAAARLHPPNVDPPRPAPVASQDVVQHVIFIVREAAIASGGGGGGGNRQRGPIRHAEGIGSDPITLRIAKPVSTSGIDDAPSALASVVLDARPLASGNIEQVGLPVGGVSFGTSTGPGSGGGVGEGIGTGIGPGRGPGIGPGSGGGIGGGVYRPGGSVAAPRVLVQVKPSYTPAALLNRVQGSVTLELVVRSSGTPSDIRVLRSLDAGLDAQAVDAVNQWRFEPGRLAGAPVDVAVIVVIDFLIR
jgi:periplasmic protein TonB